MAIEPRVRMSRVQPALRVGDLEQSVLFYSTLFGVPPAKRRPGYANFQPSLSRRRSWCCWRAAPTSRR